MTVKTLTVVQDLLATNKQAAAAIRAELRSRGFLGRLEITACHQQFQVIQLPTQRSQGLGLAVMDLARQAVEGSAHVASVQRVAGAGDEEVQRFAAAQMASAACPVVD